MGLGDLIHRYARRAGRKYQARLRESGRGGRVRKRVREDKKRYREAAETLSDLYPNLPPGVVRCGVCGNEKRVVEIENFGVHHPDHPDADESLVYPVCRNCMAQGFPEA